MFVEHKEQGEVTEAPAKLDEDSAALLRAAAYIEEHGWCQRTMKTHDGRVCMVGAVQEVTGVNVLDLFSGIGGFSLGLERTGGMRTVAFCEIDPYCRAVLRKHWPAVPCFEDVRDLHAFDVGPVDVICGGFPCQDISTAGRGAGLAGERSGLWSEYRRLIEECRPAWVVIENVSALRSRGLDQVLGEARCARV
jgi:hypothetical protein